MLRIIRAFRRERGASHRNMADDRVQPIEMPTPMSAPVPIPHSPTADLLGHPRGLAILFATEAWERFSYFGNAALIVLYMVKYLFDPVRVESVFGFGAVKAALELMFGRLDPQPLASQLFGFYTGLAYAAPVLGGLVADRLLGQHRTVVVGGVCMALGHFMMAFEALFLFALLMLILGIGAFKPNISTQVGALYAPHDSRRDRAYAVFYVGINIGAFLAPLVCGALAAAFGWHYGFAAAGVGMLVSLGIYLGGSRTLPADEAAPAPTRGQAPLARDERRAIIALIVVCALVSLFWAAFDQQGNTMLLWAEDFTDRSLDLLWWQGEIPTPWFLALNPLLIFMFTPLLVRLWTWQGAHGREPFTLSKMAFACLCVAGANVLMAAAFLLSGGGKASAWWLVGYFVLLTLGELHLAPVGLALISTLAPVRKRSLMMGVWFATTLPADILGGFLGGFWSRMAKNDFFLMIAAIAAFAAAAIWIASHALRPMLERGAGVSESRDRGA
jgi:POT family proton-dependent oligopeptide transporter